MANFRSIYKIQVFLTILIHLTVALYEDQVGKFDWKRSFVGKVKFVSLEAKRIIVATEENVLASLNLQTGDIQWRQILEDPADHQIQLLQVNQNIFTISGSQNLWLMRTWDISTGSILNEWSISNDQTVPSLFTISSDKVYHILPTIGSHIEVSIYPVDGSNTKNLPKKIPTPWLKDINDCVTTSSYFVCLANNQLNYINLAQENANFISKPIENNPKTILISFNNKIPSVLLVQNNLAKLALFNDNEIEFKPYNLMPNAISINHNDKQIIYQLEANNNKDKLIKLKSKDFLSGQDLLSKELDYPIGIGAPFILGAQNRDILLGTTDNALLLLRLPEGKILWTREEALSSIVATEFFELPVSDLDASIEHEFDGNDDIVSMFLHRISTQFQQLYNALYGNQILDKSGLVRDEFGLHKIIVVATRAGKLFALDTMSGSIAWSYRLPNIQPFLGINGEEKMFLLPQRSAQYAPLPAQCVLLAQDSTTGNGVYFQFDPITGFSSQGIQRLNYKITQAVLLPQHDKNFLKPILTITDTNEAHIYPKDSILLVKEHFSSTFLYTVDHETATLNGFSLKYSSEDALVINPTWEVNLGPSKLIEVSAKPASEIVHSQGKVLYDRSVYYKYVNPNLLAVTTVTPDQIHHSVVNIYLIDGVTGLVLHSIAHKRAKGPVHLVHSENWLVYTYFNERFRRQEVSAIELYEGHLQSNSTVFSSFAVSQLPDVQSQSYILPAVSVKMAVTQTERGITNKFLLMALTNGAVIEIPWMLLQPRFPGNPCGPEESCIPYMPEIPLYPEATINYNQTLSRIKGIVLAPARLESTSHVLVHGLDIFYTRVAPSKTFDVLKDDFDYRLIILVLSGLILATFVTKYLAARKALKQAWK